jgi:hypothetical protein
MKVFLSFLTVIFLGSTSWAQSYEIAYSKSAGKGQALYLAKSDGSGSKLLYSSKKTITGIDISPNGNKIAFSDGGALKVLSYSVSGSNVSVGSVLTLDSDGVFPDFSPDGNKVVYVSVAGAIHLKIASSQGGAPKILNHNASGAMVRYLQSGNKLVQLKLNSNDYELEVITLDSNDDVVSASTVLSTANESFMGIEDFDTARTKNSVLFTASYPNAIRIVEFNLDDSSLIDHTDGVKAHFSSDDSKILCLDTDRKFIQKYDVVSGSKVNLTKRGSFGYIDWQP